MNCAPAINSREKSWCVRQSSAIHRYHAHHCAKTMLLPCGRFVAPWCGLWVYDTLYMLIHALTLPRLDYCNDLFACSRQLTLCRLQCVQDAAITDLCGASAQSHAPRLLKWLHWLPVSSQIQFKLCTLKMICNDFFGCQSTLLDVCVYYNQIYLNIEEDQKIRKF